MAALINRSVARARFSSLRTSCTEWSSARVLDLRALSSCARRASLSESTRRESSSTGNPSVHALVQGPPRRLGAFAPLRHELPALELVVHHEEILQRIEQPAGDVAQVPLPGHVDGGRGYSHKPVVTHVL